MRCSGWSSLAISVCSALIFAGPAAAHVVATPTCLPSKSSDSITFEAPNERSDRMTEFAVTVSRGLAIEHAHPVEGWTGTVEGATATWSGGSLSSAAVVTFGMTVKSQAKPGLIELMTEQRYADGGVVDWPVVLTITPAAESPSQKLALAGVVGLIGVLVVAVIAMLAWRRRAS